MPAVGELAVLAAHVQAAQVHLVRLAVLELNELAQPRQELCVPVGAMLIGQDGELTVALQGDKRGTVAPAPRPPPSRMLPLPGSQDPKGLLLLGTQRRSDWCGWADSPTSAIDPTWRRSFIQGEAASFPSLPRCVTPLPHSLVTSLSLNWASSASEHTQSPRHPSVPAPPTCLSLHPLPHLCQFSASAGGCF